MEGRGTRCLKIAAVATLLLWCTQPMQAVANTNETQWMKTENLLLESL